MMKRSLLGLSLLLAASAFCDFDLVKGGKPAATIVLSEQPTRCAQLGAMELRFHVKKITGVDLPQITAGQKADTPNTITISSDAPGMTGDANAIEFDGTNLKLYGNDSTNTDKVDYNNASTFPALDFDCKGPLFAVYDFLELYCGVRFLGIRNFETYCPQSAELSVKEQNRRHDPKMDAFRRVYIDDDAAFRNSLNARDTHLGFLRWRNTNHYGMTNHNQYSIYFAHWDKAKNPNLAKAFKGKNEELFAKGYKGKNHGVDPILRNNYPNDPDIPPQLCYSCQATVDYYANEVLTYFNGGNVLGGWLNFSGSKPTDTVALPKIPGKPFFYPIQGGDTGGHCLCESCKKRFPNDNKDDVSHNKFQFIADVARKAGETNPEAGVSSLAYIQTLDYPDGVDFPKNVSVQICLPIYSWWHPVAKELQLGAYKKWVDNEGKNRPLTLWTYIFSTYWDARYHYGKYKAFPGLYPHKTGEIFKMFANDGLKGWFCEVEMGYNFLEAYVAAKLCYDPTLDPEVLIDEFFPLYYGEAGKAMREVYEEIEKAYWNDANCKKEWLDVKDGVMSPKGKRHKYWTTGIWSPELCWNQLGTDERMAKIDALVNEAKAKVKTPEEKQRLDHFVKHIWEPAMQGKKEFRDIALRKSRPPMKLMMPIVDNAGGNPYDIDWSKAWNTGKWCELSGSESKFNCSMDVVKDAEYLYLRFTDENTKWNSADFWSDNIEMFFAAKDKKSAVQLAVAPSGKSIAYYHDLKDGDELTDLDLGAKVRCEIAGAKWMALMAIPLEKLPGNGNAMLVDFFRSRPDTRLCWNPIYGGGYMPGIDFYGAAVSLPLTIEENDFRLSERGKATDIIEDANAGNGKAAWMRADYSWAIQINAFDHLPAGKYNVSARIRCDANAPKDAICGIGLYSTVQKREMRYITIPASEIAGEKYAVIELGVFDLTSDSYFFVRKLNTSLPENKIYLDSLTFTK